MMLLLFIIPGAALALLGLGYFGAVKMWWPT